jgi:two-component system invasion response regulator UvrY
MAALYLIEDHLVVREGLRAMLEAARYIVAGETCDPTEAISELQRLQPDVVLLDLALGERSGFEVLAEAQRRGLKARFVVLTMLAQPRHVAEAVRLGALGYVLKSAPLLELRSAIEAALQGRRYLGSCVADLAVQALAANGQVGASLDKLSPRERQIITMVVNGQSSAAIGAQLHLAAKTVDTYRSRLMAKLGVGNLPALVRLALRTGLIAFD